MNEGNEGESPLIDQIQQRQVPEIVTPTTFNDPLDRQQNLINAQRRESQGKRGNERRQKIHSVSRSVNSYRSQLVDKDVHRPREGIKRSHRVDSEEPGERGGGGRGRTTVAIIDEERAIILVPAAIDHPKVLTAETFVGGKIKFKEGTKRRRIGKRVEGETTSRQNDGQEGLFRGRPTVEELAQGGGRVAITSAETAFLNSTRQAGPPQFPSDDFKLMAARLRRFNKANLLKKKAANPASKVRPSKLPLLEYIREVGLLEEHGKEKPEVSFVIDDDREEKGKGPVSLRTKFPKNRETQRPIQLSKVDDSDMDLLSPPAGTGMKPVQRLSNHHHAQNGHRANGPLPPPPLHPPPPPHQSFAAAISQKPLGQQQPINPPIVPPTGSIHPHHHSPPIAAAPSIVAVPPLPPPPTNAFSPSSSLIQTTRPPQLATVSIGQSSPPRPTPSSSPSSSSSSFPSSSFSSNLLNPNAKLELCCRRQNLPQTCQQFCNFDTFTQEKLLVALLGTQCPVSQLGKAFDCAHSKVDHSECCQRHGIDRINGGQCMVFCRTHIPTPPNVLGYVSCLSQFGTIKNCYRDHQLKHRNLFGD